MCAGDLFDSEEDAKAFSVDCSVRSDHVAVRCTEVKLAAVSAGAPHGEVAKIWLAVPQLSEAQLSSFAYSREHIFDTEGLALGFFPVSAETGAAPAHALVLRAHVVRKHAEPEGTVHFPIAKIYTAEQALRALRDAAETFKRLYPIFARDAKINRQQGRPESADEMERIAGAFKGHAHALGLAAECWEAHTQDLEQRENEEAFANSDGEEGGL